MRHYTADATRLLAKNPRLLSSSVEKRLAPSFAVWHGQIGVSVDAFRNHPSALQLAMEKDNIRAKMLFLVGAGVPRDKYV